MTAPTNVGWRSWLALNASTGALLATILLVGMSTELWMPLMPDRLSSLDTPLLVIAAIGTLKDFFDGISFYFGGLIAAHFNTRRALIFFNIIPIIGLAFLFVWLENWWACFVAFPFVAIWNAISGPATLRVVGDSLAEHRRAMAFSLQSIQKRLSNLLAYVVSGGLVLWLGRAAGIRIAVGLALGFAILSLVIQFHYMRTASRDATKVQHRPIALLRRFDPLLKRLLLSEIAVRWCDSMLSQLAILYCVRLLTPRFFAAAESAIAFYVSILLNVRETTSLLLYLPVGHFASQRGAASKKPFIGLTFVFFALFPIALVTVAKLNVAGLIAAFAIAGLREFGEPARKALITELVPADCRTQSIGVYWAIRGLAVSPASILGGLLWCWVGPEFMLWTAGAVGAIGAMLFHVRYSGAA